MQALGISFGGRVWKNNRRHKEKGDSPAIPMSRVYFLKEQVVTYAKKYIIDAYVG
jgi:hypothetical protein